METSSKQLHMTMDTAEATPAVGASRGKAVEKEVEKREDNNKT